MFRSEIHVAITDYFELNENSADTVSTLWEAFKTVLHGACISKRAGVLRSIRTDPDNIEKEH